VERARRNVQSEPLLKEASHVTVSLPFATQFPDQVAMGFQLGAWRFGREIGKSLKNALPQAGEATVCRLLPRLRLSSEGSDDG